MSPSEAGAELAVAPAAQALGPRSATARGGRQLGRSLRRRWTLVLGLCVAVGFCLLAIAAPLISPYSPDVQNMSLALRPPSAAHPFGTDEFGRDSLSRILHGARLTLLASSLAVLLAAIVGCSVGLTAGYFGGILDTVVGRLVDILFAFPVILLGIAIVALGVTAITVTRL